jgi:hypothetical protein
VLAPTRARITIAAAVVAAGAAFGIGVVIGSPSAEPAGAEPLEVVAPPPAPAIPALAGDLARLPDLAPPPTSTPSGSGSGGGTPSQGSGGEDVFP